MTDRRLTPSLQRLRGRRRATVVWLALLAYLFAGAAVPAGHMAAPVASGAPFHLCPGDLRSAQIIDAITAAAFANQGARAPHHHHGEGAQGGDSHASMDTSTVAKSAADPGCAFAAGAAADADAPAFSALPVEAPAFIADSGRDYPSSTRRWFRPPVRSPPV